MSDNTNADAPRERIKRKREKRRPHLEVVEELCWGQPQEQRLQRGPRVLLAAVVAQLLHCLHICGAAIKPHTLVLTYYMAQGERNN